jgi:hypothetical protein
MYVFGGIVGFLGVLAVMEMGCRQVFLTEDQANRYRGGVPANLAAPPAASASLSLALEPPGLERLAQSAQSDVELKERIRQENRERKGERPRDRTVPLVWKRDRRRPTVARVYVGDGNSLELVRVQVSVTVEGPRARTVVDHVFRNPHDRQLEGTFEYPLPSGASPAYFALFQGQRRDGVPAHRDEDKPLPPLPAEKKARRTPEQLVENVDPVEWGKPQEARVVAKDKALETYEDVARQKVDPALLEYAGGNTFRGRVFPIAAKGCNRVILAYEETLPATLEGTHYRFALPAGNLEELSFDLQADDSAGAGRVVQPSGGGAEDEGAGFRYTRRWKKKGPGREVVIAFTPRADIQAIAGRRGENGPCYLYARVRPELKIERAKLFAHRAVFLLDTSLSENPDRFAVNMKLLRAILERDRDMRYFNVLTFDVAARWLEPNGWLENTPAGRDKALARLDGLLLEGATNLSAALDKLARPEFDVAAGTSVNVFLLSDGQITWGEADLCQMVARFESRCSYPLRFHCYRTGLGAENVELFEALTRRGGGVFNCFGEADVPAAAQAHRHPCFQVESVRFAGGPEMSDVLIAGRKAAIYPGGELIVAGRCELDGADAKMACRTRLIVEGRFLGEKMVREYAVEATPASELAARAWAEVAVASLLAVNDSKLDSVVTAYCQQFGIASRVASFLVLENEADYKRLNLEEERGKTITGDLGPFLDDLWSKLGEPAGARELFQRFLDKIEPRVHLLDGADGKQIKRLLSLLTDSDFELPAGEDDSKPLGKGDVPATYLRQRKTDTRNVQLYIDETRRRTLAGDADNAVRALSCVIEQFAGRSDALRLVGYRLLELHQPEAAARLFQQVEHSRPFEAHSYRDLARALQASGKHGLAAMHYEIVLAGTWHSRFGDALKTVAREEYVQMMQQATREKTVSASLTHHFGDRLEGLSAKCEPDDLRVTISWNTDATDIDLWVIEPDGTKCFYSHNRTKFGGELSQDQTQGYGPERYRIRKARPGTYKVMVHYFSVNPNLLAGETHVQVVITRHAGTPREVSERHNVILKKHNEEIEVARVKF